MPKLQKQCERCGRSFSHYECQGPGRFCSRECKKRYGAEHPEDSPLFLDLTGQVFGRLTVIRHAGHRYGSHVAWHCQCSCQAHRVVTTNSLRSGRTRSCGCLARGDGIPKPDNKRCRRCKRIFAFTAEFFVTQRGFRWGLAPCCRKCWAPIRRARHLAWRRKIKREVLMHYSHGSPRCECCGVTEIEFLTLDHVNDDGKEDRKLHGLGMLFYAKMKRLGYPRHLRVLCFNCNIARALFGQCPHTTER